MDGNSMPAAAAGSMAGMDHSNMNMSQMPAMDMTSLKQLKGKAFDRAFLSAMIPHHQAAVDMAKAVLPVSKDATVKAWANAVIKDQTREITQMNTLLKSMGGVNTAMANQMKSSMSGMADMVKVEVPSASAAGSSLRGTLPALNSACPIGARTKNATNRLTPP